MKLTMDLTTTTVPQSKRLYRTSPIKRKRRSNQELDTLVEACVRITDEDPPITIRHLFYRLTGEHLIEKTERDYTRLCAMLSTWRRQGRVSYDAFVDSTRFYYGPTLFDNLAEALEDGAVCYRKNLWKSQPYYLECWVEKDAIKMIVGDEASKFGVQTFVCRGFPSLSSLNTAAKTFLDAQRAGKTVRILYFGDHDPSGRAIDNAVENTLAEDFAVKVEFRRISVTDEQIIKYQLPTRPVKMSDTRAKGWEGGCVEIDTLRPSVLKALVEGEITSLIDPRQWDVMQTVERDEREKFMAIWRKAAA
jgi:hypothetical protein